MKDIRSFAEVRRQVMISLEKYAKAVKSAKTFEELRDIVLFALPFTVDAVFYIAPYTYNFWKMEVHHDDKGLLPFDQVPQESLLFMKGVVLGYICTYDKLLLYANNWRELL